MSDKSNITYTPTPASGIQNSSPIPEYLPGNIQESCVFKGVLSGVLGYALGAFLPFFMYGSPGGLQNQIVQQYSFRKELAMLGERMHSNGRAFGIIGLWFSASECVLEKLRGVHDSYNSYGAAICSGAWLSRKHGLGTIVGSSLSFLAFTVVIEGFIHFDTELWKREKERRTKEEGF